MGPGSELAAPRRAEMVGRRGSSAPASLERACAAHRRASAARLSGSPSLAARLAWLAHSRSFPSAGVRGVTVLRLELPRQPLGQRRDALAARGKLRHQLSAHPGHLAAVPIGAADPADPEHARQGRLHHQRGDRCRRAPMLMQSLRIQGAVGAVSFPHHPVQDQVVDVQLGVPVPAGVLSERAHDEPVRVLPPPRPYAPGLTAVIAGAGIPGLALQVIQRCPVPRLHARPHIIRGLFPVGDGFQIAFGGRAGRVRHRRSVQQRDRLRHTERRVEILHGRPDLRLRFYHQLSAALRGRLRLQRQQHRVDLLG
jgi:hypothetical protein